ncbi:MAG: hypothetical protein M1818_001519 [Claussenomyces sp. TS43310]|nr:MAG: hypothetical protein M1818_001519 [Claussenomyces sp. TS43310]
MQNHFVWGDAACYPPTIQTSEGTEVWGNYYYSPGICPLGWTSVADQSISPAGLPTTLPASITAALCCPLGWFPYGGGVAGWSSHGCTTAWTSGHVLKNVWDVPSTYQNMLSSTDPATKTLTALTLQADASAVCDGIPIMWQNTDTAILRLLGQSIPTTVTSGSSGSSRATSSPTTSMPTPTPTAVLAYNPAPPSGLSTGAKIGLGVALPVGVIALLLAIFFTIRRRKHRHLAGISNIGAYGGALPEDQGRYVPMQKFDGPPQELDPAASVIPEMGPGHEAQELYATPTATRTQLASPFRSRLPLETRQSASEPLLRAISDEDISTTSAIAASLPMKSPAGSQARIDELRARIGQMRAEGSELTGGQTPMLEELEAELRREVTKRRNDDRSE